MTTGLVSVNSLHANGSPVIASDQGDRMQGILKICLTPGSFPPGTGGSAWMLKEGRRGFTSRLHNIQGLWSLAMNFQSLPFLVNKMVTVTPNSQGGFEDYMRCSHSIRVSTVCALLPFSEYQGMELSSCAVCYFQGSPALERMFSNPVCQGWNGDWR